MAIRLTVKHDGAETGPFTEGELVSLIEQGGYGPTATVKREKDDNWFPMDSIPSFAAIFRMRKAREEVAKRPKSKFLSLLLALSLILNVGLGYLALRQGEFLSEPVTSFSTGSQVPSQVSRSIPRPVETQAAAGDLTQSLGSPNPNESVFVPIQEASKDAKPTTKETQIKPLPDIAVALSMMAFDESTWALSVQYADKKVDRYSLRTIKEEIEALRSSVDQPAATESESLTRKHFRDILEVCSGSRLTMAGGEVLRFIPGITPTMSFATVDSKPCFVLSNMTTGMIYNTRRLGAKERAAEVVQTAILPLLRECEPFFDALQVESIALVHFFGSKPFGDESPLETRGEIVCLVLTKTDVADFVRTKISREELVRRSSVFLADRDNQHAFSRIELMLR